MRLKHVAIGLLAVALVGSMSFPFQAHEEGETGELTIYMGEMYFRPEGGEAGDPITVEAGRPYLITVVNEGQVEHEIHFGRNPEVEEAHYLDNLFGPMGEEHGAHGWLGLHLKPGESGQLHVWIPSNMTGEWELGCFMPGHYQADMKAPFIVE